MAGTVVIAPESRLRWLYAQIRNDLWLWQRELPFAWWSMVNHRLVIQEYAGGIDDEYWEELGYLEVDQSHWYRHDMIAAASGR